MERQTKFQTDFITAAQLVVHLNTCMVMYTDSATCDCFTLL